MTRKISGRILNLNYRAKNKNILKNIFMVVFLGFILIMLPNSVLTEDRLIIKDGPGPDANDSFKVTHEGVITSFFTGSYLEGDGLTRLLTLSSDNQAPGKVSDVGFLLNNAGENFTWLFRTYEPGDGFVLTKLNTGGPEMTVVNATSDFRNVSFEMGNGAKCTSSGVWQNASSREYKKDIHDLTADEAVATLVGLRPVRFHYKNDSEDEYVGFIAEDVPDLVATKDRKGMSPMDVVAVLTKVVKEQQKTIDELSKKVSELEKH